MSRSDCRACWACWVYSNYESYAGLTCSLSQVSEVVGVHRQPQLVLTQQAQQGQRPPFRAASAEDPARLRRSEGHAPAEASFWPQEREPSLSPRSPEAPGAPQRPGSRYTKRITASSSGVRTSCARKSLENWARSHGCCTPEPDRA
jgi:hypothetical protein